MTKWQILFGAAVILGLAIVFEVPFGRGDVAVFKQLKHLQSPLQRVLVYVGFVRDPALDFPASLFATFDTGCSATLVGPDSLLTAGHCAKWSEYITLQINGDEFYASCTASDSPDIALCQLNSYVEGIVFDVIEHDPPLAGGGKTIRMVGWSGQPHNFFTRWLLNIVWLFGLGSGFRQGTGTITSSAMLLSVLGDPVGGTPFVLEMGDSGGAGYAEQGSKRTIVGVNNCGGEFCAGVGTATAATNVLTNVTDSSVAAWIARWAGDNAAQVCGLTTTISCRP